MLACGLVRPRAPMPDAPPRTFVFVGPNDAGDLITNASDGKVCSGTLVVPQATARTVAVDNFGGVDPRHA